MGGPIILKAAGVAVLAVAGVAAYLFLWPIPAEPVSWPAQKPPGYTGAFAPNTRLSGLRMIDTGSEVGPEHIACMTRAAAIQKPQVRPRPPIASTSTA